MSNPRNDKRINTTIEAKATEPTTLPESNLAKYIFDLENLVKFKDLIESMPKPKLLLQLNSLQVTKKQIDQLKLYIDKQDEYPEIFKLNPAIWLDILLNEKLIGNDMAALFCSTEIVDGAVSGIISAINDIEDNAIKADAYFFLNNSIESSDKEIRNYLRTIKFPKDCEASYLSLHHIMHNVTEPHVYDDGTQGTKAAAESILRISDPKSDIDSARLKGALRIIKECVNNNFMKVMNSLPQDKLSKIKIKHEKFLNEQQDLLYARKLNKELNGDLSLRDQPYESFNYINQAIAVRFLNILSGLRQNSDPAMRDFYSEIESKVHNRGSAINISDVRAYRNQLASLTMFSMTRETLNSPPEAKPQDEDLTTSRRFVVNRLAYLTPSAINEARLEEKKAAEEEDEDYLDHKPIGPNI